MTSSLESSFISYIVVLEIFKSCLYGRREGTFFIPGLHENVSNRDDFTRDFNKGSIISASRQSGTECLHDKKCHAFPRFLVERTEIPLCQGGTKNVPANILLI